MTTVEGKIQTQSTHNIWYRVSGNQQGIPILLCNGGPGGYSKDEILQDFDLQQVWVIQFDERGCGRSTPTGELDENTLSHTLEDIERLRECLGVAQWVVSGSSWGSTVALRYAQQYSNRVRGLFLGSVFLGRRQDIDWLDREVMRFFPELHQFAHSLLRDVPLEEWHQQVYDSLMSQDENLHRQALAFVSSWDGNLYQLASPVRLFDPAQVDMEYLSAARIYAHYHHHLFFLKDYDILEHCDDIVDIPTMILHGRYDMMCPPEQAYALHTRLPKSQLEITNFDGHKLSAETRRLRGYMWRELLHIIQAS
jgi:proline iminopeptidase